MICCHACLVFIVECDMISTSHQNRVSTTSDNEEHQWIAGLHHHSSTILQKLLYSLIVMKTLLLLLRLIMDWIGVQSRKIEHSLVQLFLCLMLFTRRMTKWILIISFCWMNKILHKEFLLLKIYLVHSFLWFLPLSASFHKWVRHFHLGS